MRFLMDSQFPAQSDADRTIRLAAIVTAMANAGLPSGFVAACNKYALSDQGIYELMELWSEAVTEEDRDQALADLQELINDKRSLPAKPEERPYITFDSLDRVGESIAAHKGRLRVLVEKNGGVVAVAKKMGVPQPSLSRMLNSGSMPRRTTLYKLATALGVPESEIVGEYVQ